MVVDSSALMAIALGEPERDMFFFLLRRAATRRMSAASYVECAEVYLRQLDHEGGLDLLARDVRRLGIAVVDVTADQAFMAARARLTYGRGRHRAKLNYGDAFAYALAKVMDEPLLFKGNDFIHTDVKRAIP